MAQPRRTVPLTRAQLQTAAGAELLVLCQTITEDGSIKEDEVSALRDWLQRNHDSDLPSVEFLTSTVEKIIADGRVDEWERRDLHKALERVLPPEQRARAVEARREADYREITNDPRAFQDLDRIGDVYDFMVAGVHYENRADVIDEFVRTGDLVYFVRDRDNRFSRNAVEVRIANGLMIGYVPEQFAVEVAPLLDKGHRYHAWVKKLLDGSRVTIPVVLAEVLRKDAVFSFALRESELPVMDGMRSVAHLATAKGAAADALKRFTELLTLDVQSLNGREIGLEQAEKYVEGLATIPPALDAFLHRTAGEGRTREVAREQTVSVIRTALGQLSTVLDRLAPDAAEALHLARIMQRIETLLAPARPVGSPAAAPEPAPLRASGPVAVERPPPASEPRFAPRLTMALVLLALAVAMVLVFTR
jgi:hypothetical protein